MSFWFSFPLWPRILNISSCIYLPFVSSFEIVCSVHLPIYSIGCWFYVGLVFWAPCIFWLLITCQICSWQRFFSHSILLYVVTVSSTA
jgi:hypothetical protein